jgi:hypothetical protein
MPLYTFVDNAVPSSSIWNANHRDQVITQCLSTGRPAAPVTGQHIIQTDNGLFLRWNGTAWVGAAVQLLAFAVGTVAQTAQTTADLTGCTVSFPVESAWRFRTSISLPRAVQSGGANSEHRLIISNGAGGDLRRTTQQVVLGTPAAQHIEWIETGLTGTITRNARLQALAGTWDTLAGFLPIIMVELLNG